jgi:hypothetical protein
MPNACCSYTSYFNIYKQDILLTCLGYFLLRYPIIYAIFWASIGIEVSFSSHEVHMSQAVAFLGIMLLIFCQKNFSSQLLNSNETNPPDRLLCIWLLAILKTILFYILFVNLYVLLFSHSPPLIYFRFTEIDHVWLRFFSCIRHHYVHLLIQYSST